MESPLIWSGNADLNTFTSSGTWGEVAKRAIEVHKAQQDWHELSILLAFLARTSIPALIIELGYGDGGLAWALRQLPSQPTVLSVTLPNPVTDAYRTAPTSRQHIIPGDTQDPATHQAVISWLGDQRADLLIIDADHKYDSALQDWIAYSPLVKPTGLVMFHDIAMAIGYPEVQVHRLWQELKADHYVTEIVSNPSGLAGIGLVWGKRNPLR